MPNQPLIPGRDYAHLCARLDRAQRIAGIGDWETDLAHEHLHWSDQVYRILGLSPDSGPPQSATFYRAVHPEDLDFVRRTKQAVAQGVPVPPFEHRIVRPDGEIRHVQQVAEVSRNAEHRPVGITGTIQDITERKQAEAGLLRAQRVNSIGTLASGIAHDLNNALTPILMAAELLRTGRTNPEETHLLDMIRAGAERSASMVRQILTFARGAEGDRGTVQIAALVDELVEISRQTFSKTIAVRAEIGPGLPALVANPVQLHQVLMNLCVNARDAMPDGGALTLGAAAIELDAERAATLSPDAAPGRFVVLRARDTGHGMTPEIRARIFEPFFTTKAAEHGTGLGLSIVRSVVTDHGGFVTVDSKVGEGTEVQVWLPVRAVAMAIAARAERTVPPMGHGETILVVDDEAAIRSLATDILRMSGYEVLTAANGARAVLLCEQHQEKISLMITDMDMPVMDGATAIRVVATVAPKIRIIATSGTDPASLASVLLLPGISGTLHKPYSADELLQVVSEVLRR